MKRIRECRMNGPAPAAPVPAVGILVTAPAPEQPGQPEQFLVTPIGEGYSQNSEHGW